LAGTAVDRALASVYRAPLDFATVYMDLDDTLTAGDGVNPDAVKFLFQCRNRGRRLILLTRHAVSPRSTLRRLRLESLFDETIWLRKGEDKSSRICEKNAVFIDDSFSERQEVSQRTGIPVFDVSAIEGLLEP
ncbi:MAG: HAD family hydrolase, partial [Planctomycetota bacterium]|nr:HAD family hydrolase [Planctomycetota bacterium]